jgi:transketolase
VASPDAPGLAGFAAAAWSVRRVDACDGADVAAALSAALRSQRPTLIACIWPHRMVAEDHQPEDCLAESLQAWLATGKRCAGIRRAWLKRLTRHASRQEFDNAMAGKLPAGWHAPFFEPGPLLAPGETAISTAATLRHAMLRMSATVPEITRLPADEAGRPGSAPAEASLVRDVPAGMVQGVGAAAAGLALHGGTVPVTKVSLAQATAMLATLRDAATASLRLVTFMAEPDRACPAGGQRASLRSIGNLCIFRPADASELLECAELAFRRAGGPTVLLVSEAPVPLLSDRPTRTRCAKGGYVLAEAPSRRAVTLIASGPELQLALAVRAHLAAMGTPAAVVSLPCWRLFARQELSWQEAVLGGAPRVGIEAGSGFGWEKWLGPHGLFIGQEQIEGMTASGTAPQSAVSRIAELVLRHLGVVRAV